VGIRNRLKQWTDLQRVRPTEELPDVAGGRDGELLLKQLLRSSYQFKEAHLIAGRRIPSKTQGRRREIDLIVCTPRMIHLIEVKHWSGRLNVRNGAWSQTRRSGEVIEHGNLTASNQLKRDAVIEYLRDRGLELDDQRLQSLIAPKLIFTNPNLELEPAIESRSDVISRRELDAYLRSQPQKSPSAESMFTSLIAYCLDWESKRRPSGAPGDLQVAASTRPIPTGQYKRIVTCLEEAGTWDQLRLYGGRAIAGDLLSVRVGGTTYRVGELREMAGTRSPIRLRWTRGRVWGLIKAITGLGPAGTLIAGTTRLTLATTDTVLFHVVGEREASNRKLVDVEHIALGS